MEISTNFICNLTITKYQDYYREAKYLNTCDELKSLTKKAVDTMAEKWYEQLGYSYNPFTLNPMMFEDDHLIGMEKEAKEVLYRIQSSNMLFIEGEEGSGKTMLLKHAIENFKGKGKVIYVDARRLNKKLDIEELLIKKYGLIKGRLMKSKPKNMILLLDNVDEISWTNNERLKYFFDQDYLKSVVFTSEKMSKVTFSDSIKERIGSRVIKVPQMKTKDVVEMVHDRMGDEEILDADIVKKIFASSGKNPQKTLINCFRVSEYAVDLDEEIVTDKHVNEALKKDEDVEELHEEMPDTEACEECEGRLVLVGRYWRCPECDIYCGGCGALVEVEDKECPECKGVFEN